MAPYRIAVLLALLVAIASGLKGGSSWTPAVETEPVGLANKVIEGVPPKPTTPPGRYAAIPQLAHDEVVGTDTCGYLTEDGRPMTCGSGYTCTNSGNIRDCCYGGDCATSTFSTACIDSTACPSGSHAGAYCCTYSTQFPYCITYFWETSATPNRIFTFYNCGAKQVAGQEILAATPPSTSTTTSSSSSSSSTTTSSSTTSTSTSSSTSTSTSPATPTPTPKSHHSTPVGAIVGGVVGGVAVIALVALGVFLIMRRTRANKPNGDNSQVVGNPGPYSPGPPPQPEAKFTGAPVITPDSNNGYNPSYGYSGAPTLMSASPPPQGYDQRYSYAPTAVSGVTQSLSPVGGGLPSPSLHGEQLAHSADGAGLDKLYTHGEHAVPPLGVPPQEVVEADSTALRGTGDNRAELV